MRPLSSFAPAALSLSALLWLSPGCETFDGPPEPRLPDARGGLLGDPAAPVRVRFSKPIDRETLKVLIVPLEVDGNDRLLDERGAPEEIGQEPGVLNPLYGFNPETFGDFGGTHRFSDDGREFFADLTARLPVGQRLAVLVEPGLANLTNGLTTNVRRRLPFALEFKCSDKGTQIAKSGPYFFLLNVEEPLQIQVQLLAWLDIDPETGRFVGRFSNADRLPNRGKCPSACSGIDVCQTSPSTACVQASEPAQSTDDFIDFFPQMDPQLGYGVTVQGCAEDQEDGSVAIATAPANLVIPSPPVQINALTVVTAFRPSSDGVLRGTGGGSADNAVFGTGDLGRASGTVFGRALSDAEAPEGIPRPPPLE